MKKFFQHLAGISLLALGMLWVNPQAHSVEIGVGARIGGELNWNAYWPGDGIASMIYAFNEANSLLNSYAHPKSLIMSGFGGGFTLGGYADLRLAQWFSLTTGLQITLGRRAWNEIDMTITDGDVLEKTGSKLEFYAAHTSIDVDLLAKFHVGWWYFGVGPGLTFNTAPKSAEVTLRTYLLGAELSSETIKASKEDVKGSIGVNVVVDTGLYIPLGQGNHNITIGLRGTLDLATVAKQNGIWEEPHEERIYGHTGLSLGLTLGYLYRFQ
ncbi:hypothetical protein [Entomospira culicis]|uniref:Outer membrane protein beta-barrel domain-containing protein n=1 Tax=Entomospira culicis TaxID=2719989 RepID=A0A968GIT1_9SPIO|nr:hypothetical protein [Entomospira culicis]NIZ19361.1 hypothetical protein [Entomospira culicis]NIZ69734.1 hypothetical protein [Entomospira culicis]WDI36845.1 hypothetical protein PVA46_05835 [Entomospira culicis]WDI38474.1 hypothetical protein PVA47_05845 [Entomospira culicis]